MSFNVLSSFFLGPPLYPHRPASSISCPPVPDPTEINEEPYCLSVWVALPFVPWITRSPGSGLVVWAALSGAAIVVERLTDRSPPPAAWHEDTRP